MSSDLTNRPGGEGDDSATVTLKGPDGLPLPSGPAHAARDPLRWPLLTGLPLAAILAIAAFLRFWQLAAVGFNSDEAVYTGTASSIAGDSTLGAMFPVFRAHPLLFQTLLSLVLRVHESDWTARAFSAAIGVATVAVTYLLASQLFGRRAGLLAGLLLAVMPYHVIVTRQVLLDGLMTLCATVALYCVVRYLEAGTLSWLVAAGGMMGATILAKETSVILLGGLYAFFALTPSARARARHILLALAVMCAVAFVFPLALRLAGRSSTGQHYLLWQMFRPANHGTWFYFTELPLWIGPAVLAATAAGLVLLRREATWRERLLLTWVLIPVLFFTIWPVKGFQYLLPVAPPLAVLAGRTLSHPLPVSGPSWLTQPRRPSRLAWASRIGWQPSLFGVALGALALASVVSLAVPTWNRVEPSTTGTFLAGTGGLSGGRQAGDWIRHNVPAGAHLLTIGPSMANVLEFYSERAVSALSVSANPHNRNPAYVPVTNPDRALRDGDYQYVVWDSYTATRAPFFANESLRLADKYHGAAVFTATVTVRARSGHRIVKPVVIVYEVHPT